MGHAVQLAAATALTDVAADDEVSRHVVETRLRGAGFLADLARVPGLTAAGLPHGGFYAFVDVHEFARRHRIPAEGHRTVGDAVADHLLHDRGVAVVPGSAFGPAGDGFVRMSFAGDAEQLGCAVERLAG